MVAIIIFPLIIFHSDQFDLIGIFWFYPLYVHRLYSPWWSMLALLHVSRPFIICWSDPLLYTRLNGGHPVGIELVNIPFLLNPEISTHMALGLNVPCLLSFSPSQLPNHSNQALKLLLSLSLSLLLYLSLSLFLFFWSKNSFATNTSLLILQILVNKLSNPFSSFSLPDQTPMSTDHLFFSNHFPWSLRSLPLSNPPSPNRSTISIIPPIAFHRPRPKCAADRSLTPLSVPHNCPSPPLSSDSVAEYFCASIGWIRRTTDHPSQSPFVSPKLLQFRPFSNFTFTSFI